MTAGYILAVLSVVFLTAALVRRRASGWAHPQVRAQLLVGMFFGLVSVWLLGS